MSEPTRKKVLFLITKSNWGGAQRYVYDLATNLPPHYEPVVMLGGNGELIDKLKSAHVRVIRIPKLQRDISLKNEIASTLQIWKLVRREAPDVLHVNSSKAGGIGAFIGRISRVPMVVFTAHGWAFNEDRPTWQRHIIKFFHWLTVMLSHHTIAVSVAIKAQLRWPFAGRKMTIVHNGRRAPAHLPKSDARAELIKRVPRLEAYKDELWTGTIAELHPIKRHDLMITAVARLKDEGVTLRHIIIGDGELRSELEALVREHGLSEHVFFAGPILEAARLLKAFDIFTLTSRSEALAYTVVEAAQARLPIVASRVGGLPEIIEDKRHGFLFEPGNLDDLVACLSKLITDSDTQTTFAQAALERSRIFSIENMVRGTTAIYDSKTS